MADLAPVETRASVETEREAAPIAQAFYKSPVFLAAITALGTSLGSVFTAYKPDVPFKQQIPVLGPMIVAAVSAAVAAALRATSSLQPLSLSDKH